MKTSPDCLPCFLNQTLRVARLQNCDEKRSVEILKSVAEVITTIDPDKTPPANAVAIYDTIARVSGVADPYYQVKRQENSRALALLPKLREEVRSAERPLFAAIGFAIAGNIIDYGAMATFDVEAMFEKSRNMDFGIDHRNWLLEKLDTLSQGDHILYLTDNCGEIVYDTLLVELLVERGFQVTVAVKEAPIINDALKEDACEAGLDRFANIITNGTACPGTPIESCSEEFLEHFYSADLVISKGQGNFETLSEVEREIFFLLTVKCKMVGKHLADISDNVHTLSGNGEMVVYHSRQK
ncbi:damage-control phosphatase ARMT1 family protein [Desulfosediminicola ganghwensis]|uniref:damage-control phosphatase ARMT1 family protein n=1 Tax=Desulfosediminicola ganghwensis TaxID=2569540 RepID=UPI0010ABA6BA|nr:ARMT1-like domain-containing protein [Desulfosediminicola ganghwensis]